MTDEELEELNKKLQENTTPKINESSYEAMLENLGKEEGYDYLADYDVLKNSRLAQSYSPRTNKVYTYEEAQALTPKQYWEDVMGAANHTDKGTSKEELAKSIGTSTIASAFLGPLAAPLVTDSLVKALNTNTGKTFVWGINEGAGGTALYKAIKGEEAVQNKQNQIERVYGDNQFARTTGNVVGNLASYTLGSALGGVPGAAIAGGISGAGQAYTYSNDPSEIIKGGAVGAVSGLARGATSQTVKSTLARNFPGLIANNYGTVGGMTQNVPGSFAVNAVSSGAGAYAGSAAGGTTGNVINALAGKEVTAEDWKDPFWSAETLTNVAISSLVGGTLGAVGDARAINQLKTDVKSLSSSADSTRKEVYNALKNNDVAKAKTLATSELAKINNVANKEYAGMRLSDDFRLQANAEWYNQMKVMFESFGIPFDQSMLPGSTQLTIGSGTGVIPSGVGSNAASTLQQSPNLSVTPNIANATNTTSAGQLSPSNIDYTDGKNHVVEEFKQVFPDWQLTEDNVGRVVDFFEKHKSDFQDTRDGKTRVLTTMIDDNLVKLTTTVENGKLYIDELYVEKPNQGIGTQVVNVLKNYAEKANLTDIVPMKELSTAKGFWDKALGRDVDSNAANGIISSRGGGSDVTRELGGNVANQAGGVSARLGIQQRTNSTNNQNVRYNRETNVPVQQNVGSVVGQTRDDGTDGARNNTKLQGTTTNNRLKHKKYTDWEDEAYVSPSGTIIRLGEHKDDIVNSLSMEDASNMFKRAFTNAFSGNKYSNFRDWLSKEPPEKIAKAVLNNELLKTKYISPSKALNENPELLRGVVGAYRNGELIGDDKKLEYGNVDRAREGKFAAKSYKYEPKQTSDRRNAEDLLKAAKGLNKKVAEEAKAEFIINSHDKAWLKREKMTSAEANKIIEGWGTNYSKNALRTINEVNANVSDYNKWTGIENSNIINMSTITLEDLEKLGLSVKEQDVNAHPDLLKYIANTILAVDTHQSWYGLKVLVETDKFDENVRGELLPDNTTIDIYKNGPQTVSHEMGHWLDYQWGSEIATRWLNIPHNDFLTHRLDYDFLEKISPFEEATNFIKHFYSFMDSLGKTAYLKTEYLQREHEIFARFFADFVKWTSNLAGNDIMGNDESITYREEKFTVGQFKEFVKLLQEKSAVTTILDNNPKTKYSEFERQLVYGDNGDNIADFLKDEFLKSKSEEEFLENIASDKQNSLSRDLSELIIDDMWFENSFKRVYDILSKEGVSATNPPLTAIHILQALRGSTPVKTINNNRTYQGVFDKRSTPLEEANDNLRNELAKKEDEVQATEMWSKRTERKKLNKKLDTAKNKLEQTKFEGKEKLKATKEEGREKLSRLTSKKNEEKAQAVKEVKTNATEALKKQKAKDQAILKEAKLDAKATTTKKKFGRANTKLEKALTNVYDKPQSKELDTALEALKKATRGTTKLINKVRTQIPSSMSVVIDDINEILDTYYTGANKMTDEKRASLIKKAEAIEKYAKEHPTVPISKQALDVIKQSTQKSLSDLNPKDLVDLAENVQTIGMDLRDSMSFTRASEDAVKLREEAINFVKGEIAKGGKRTDVPTGKVANTSVEFMRGYHDFNSNITRLITNLSGGNPNSPLYFMDDRLREGTVKYFEFQEKLLSFFEKMVEVQRVSGLGKRVVNKLDYVTNPKNKLKTIVKTSKGENHSLTIADGISIVLGRKDLQFAGHTTGVVTGKLDKDGKPIVSEGGYVILANQADAINGNINKGLRRGVRVKLTNEIVDKLQAELENIPAAKELMDIYSNSGFLKENARIVNDAYEAITGMSIDERENYFRTVVNPNDRRRSQSQDPTKSADLSAKDVLLNTSIVKPVVEGANNSIYIYPIGDVINKMIDDSSIYGAFATELYDIETFLNAADKDGVSLRELIGNLDPDFLTELGQIEDAIIHRRRNTVGANILEKTKNLVGNYSGSILHGNAFLALKQIGSLPTAAPFFQTPTQSILNGMFNKSGIEKMVREHFESIGEDVSSLSDKEVFDKFFKEATTELETRKRGYTKPTKAEIFRYASPLKRIEAFDWYKSTDNWTVNNLAYAMVYDYLTNFGEEISHEELVRELGSQFIKMHYATQPNTAPYTRTLGQLSDNPLARAALYMADPRLKQANTTFIARQHYKWSKENGTAEDKKKYGREFAGAIVGALSGMAYIIALNEVKSKLKNKDKNKTAKDVLTDVIANTLSIYAIGFDMIINRIISKDYDFDVSVPDTEVINKLNEMYKHGSNFIKHTANGEDNYKYKDIKNIISDLSYITGVPAKNLQDDFMYFLSAIDSPLYYEMKIKEDANMYKKYLQFEDRIDDYKDFYDLYKATRESVVKEKYGTYNNKNIKKAIQDADGDVSVYYKVFKLGK